MSIRVFISHSTWQREHLEQRLKDQVPAHAQFRQQLFDQLVAANTPQIEPIIDTAIPIGIDWRDFLFEKLADCQAAIVLVNEQALQHSDWVDVEVTVLAYRARSNKDGFRLILVPFGGVSRTDIGAKARWNPLALVDFQTIPRDTLDLQALGAADQTIEAIVAELRNLPDLAADMSRSGWLVARLCALLPREAEALTFIAGKLGVVIAGVTNFVARRRVALELYRKGPSALEAVLSCPQCTTPSNELQHMLDILATFWIDMSASISILDVLKRPSPNRVLAINGQNEYFTPQAYLRQVCNLQSLWPLVVIDVRDAIIEQIRAELIPRFSGPSLQRAKRGGTEAVDAALNAIMSQPDSAPVFVTFAQPGGGSVDDIVRQIHDAFPHVHVIVCTGTDPGGALVTPNVRMLTPELELTQEKEALTAYETIGTEIDS